MIDGVRHGSDRIAPIPARLEIELDVLHRVCREIAREQLYELHTQVINSTGEPSGEVRLQLPQLAALVEIADCLDGIEKSLDTGVKILDIGQ